MGLSAIFFPNYTQNHVVTYINSPVQKLVCQCILIENQLKVHRNQ